MKNVQLKILMALTAIMMCSCATSNKDIGTPVGGVIDFSKAEYINFLSLDTITAGMQRLKPSYRVTLESGFTKFSYNFEMNNSSKIIDSFRNFCSSKGGKYLSSDWTVGLCTKTDSVEDSLFFVNLKPVDGFGPNFKFVNLWVLEPTGISTSGYEQFVRSSGYLSPTQISDKQEEGVEKSEALRVYHYMRTVGSKVCKNQGSSTIAGNIEKVTIDKIQIRTEEQKIIWETFAGWHPCN